MNGRLPLPWLALCLLVSACTAPDPASTIEREVLVRSVSLDSFYWNDEGPRPDFDADRAACADTIVEDAFLRIQPQLNLLVMMQGCLSKRGWEFETPRQRLLRYQAARARQKAKQAANPTKAR